MYKKIITFIAAGALLAGCTAMGSNVVDVKKIEKQEYQLANKYEDVGMTIAFEDGRIYGFSGVNRYFGSAVIDDKNIEIGNVASTMMAGPEDRMQAEHGFMQLLSDAKTIEMKDDAIVITTNSNEQLIFKKK